MGLPSKAGDFLPHRFPFVMLDTFEITEQGKSGRGLKLVTPEEFWLSGGGQLPQVFVIEAMAQLSGLVGGRKSSSRLAGVREMEFKSVPKAGDSIILESTLEGGFGGLFVFSCNARTGEGEIASGKVMLQLK